MGRISSQREDRELKELAHGVCTIHLAGNMGCRPVLFGSDRFRHLEVVERGGISCVVDRGYRVAVERVDEGQPR